MKINSGKIPRIKNQKGSNTINRVLNKKEVGNSYKDSYYKDSEQSKYKKEAEQVYYELIKRGYADSFCLHHVDEILQKGTNISGRIFGELEINGLIESIGPMVSKKGTTVQHFKIIDINKPCKLTVKKPRKLKKEIREVEKDLQDIMKFCINPEIKYDRNSKYKIMAMIAYIVADLGAGKDLKDINIINKFKHDVDENGKIITYRIEASEFIRKILNLTKTFRN